MDGRPLKGRPFHVAPARLGRHRGASEGALDKVGQPSTALLTDGNALLSRPVVTPVASNLSIVAIFRDTPVNARRPSSDAYIKRKGPWSDSNTPASPADFAGTGQRPS